MEQKVKIKTNSYKDEYAYSGLTGTVYIVHSHGRSKIFLDEKSAEIIHEYNAEHDQAFTCTPFISKENLIFPKNLRVE